MDIKKKLENIWYYYKIPIIIGIFVVYVLVNTVIQKINTPTYDHSVAIVSKYNYPSAENVERMRLIFEEKYGGTFDIVIYNIALGEIGEDEILISKLSLDIGNKISEYYFIEDMETFKKTTANVEFSDVVLVSDLDWLSNLGLDNFYFCIRK